MINCTGFAAEEAPCARVPVESRQLGTFLRVEYTSLGTAQTHFTSGELTCILAAFPIAATCVEMIGIAVN